MLARYSVKFGIYKNNVFKEQLFPFDVIPIIVWECSASASRGVRSVFYFLSSIGVLNYRAHGGYLSQVVDDSRMVSVRTPRAGLLVPQVSVEQEVYKGMPLAKIMDPTDGELLAEIYAPSDGIVFFIDNGPLTYEHTAVFKLISLD